MSKKIYIGSNEIAGSDGKSAYQSWLDQGNTGTEAQFLASLKGADGKDGKDGAQGNTGSSVDYPYELVNNVTTNDATKGLSAAQGVVLDEKISQLGLKVDNLSVDDISYESSVGRVSLPLHRVLWTINGSTNKVVSAAGYNCCYAKVENFRGKLMSIVPRDGITHKYKFVSDLPSVGDTLSMDELSETTLSIPNDANYIIWPANSVGSSLFPLELYISDPSSNSESVLNDGTWEQGTITDKGKNYVSTKAIRTVDGNARLITNDIKEKGLIFSAEDVTYNYVIKAEFYTFASSASNNLTNIRDTETTFYDIASGIPASAIPSSAQAMRLILIRKIDGENQSFDVTDLATAGIKEVIGELSYRQTLAEKLDELDEAKSSIDEVYNILLGGKYVTYEIDTTWASGSLIADQTDEGYGTVAENSGWETSDLIPTQDNTYLIYPVCPSSSRSGVGTHSGIIFYNASSEIVAAYPGGYAVSDNFYLKALKIPDNAISVKVSCLSDVKGSIYLAKETTNNVLAEEEDNNYSEIGVIVGESLPIQFTTATDNDVQRIVVGNSVTEYKHESLSSYTDRLGIDISGRNYESHYLVRFDFSCSRAIPNNIYVLLKNSTNVTVGTFSNPNEIKGTSYAQLNANGSYSGKFVGIIPPCLYNATLITFDSQNFPNDSRFELYNVRVQEFIPNTLIALSPFNTWQKTYTYEGEKIEIARNRIAFSEYMDIHNLSNGQAMCCYGDYAFMFNGTGNKVDVYNLATKTYLGEVASPFGFVSDNLHCNTAYFSSEKYQSEDDFPILYVSSNYAITDGSKIYGFRVQKDSEDNFSLTLVHTITYSSNEWTEWTYAGRFLYARIEGVIAKFETPLCSSGDVTLTVDDIIASVPLNDYLRDAGVATQGYFYNNGRLFTTWGTTTPFYFGAISVNTGEIMSLACLSDMGLSNEPEAVFMYGGDMYFATRRKIYRLYFD